MCVFMGAEDIDLANEATINSGEAFLIQNTQKRTPTRVESMTFQNTGWTL